MPSMKRIPSSIRVRRNDSDYQRRTPTNEYTEDDDDYLRQEIGVVRQAIHDHDERQRTGQSPAHEHAELPPFRLNQLEPPPSQQQSDPQPPARRSSRRMGAVENLALRHKKQQRKEQRAASTAATSSSASERSRSSTTDDDLRRNRSNSAENEGATGPATAAAASSQSHPHPHRQLSHVTEENPRTAGPSTSHSTNAPYSAADSYFDAPQEPSATTRPRRNTATDEGKLAASRQFFGSLLRRNTDAPAQRLEDDEQGPAQSTATTPGSSAVSDLHEDEVVDYLDVVDPEVSTVTTLQNVGNSIFFPPIPKLYSRRPTISLPSMGQRRPPRDGTPASEYQPDDIEMGVQGTGVDTDKLSTKQNAAAPSGLRRVTSYVTGRRKKSVPETTEEERRRHIQEWADMDEDERYELDEHVEMLLTRKAKFKRGLKGFWRYVKTPHGLIITLYAVSITFWGTAICLFLLRWINVHNAARQRYWIEICDQILCALFTAVGLGFAPFRAVDTYRMVQIVHYHKLTYKRRKQLDLPELQDKNELPRATPRVQAEQMANAIFIKTGLRKDPNALVQSAAAGEDVNPESAGANTTHSSVEGLQLQTSRHSSEVERLKEMHKHHRPGFLRKKKEQSGAGADAAAAADQADKTRKSESPARPLPKTYVNKDGVMPLGHLKRNPSIASELVRDAEDVVVLNPKQQANLEYQQRKFHESHTFYRYRETVTHRPFELALMMAVVILLDAHSCLQASLGGTTWGIYYKRRPTSVTATIITFSLSCNAVAGILIWWGGSRTKKKDEVSRLLRIALEEQALHKIQKKHNRQQQEQQQQQQHEQQQLTQTQSVSPATQRQDARAHNDDNGHIPGSRDPRDPRDPLQPVVSSRRTGPTVDDDDNAAPIQRTPALESIQEH